MKQAALQPGMLTCSENGVNEASFSVWGLGMRGGVAEQCQPSPWKNP